MKPSTFVAPLLLPILLDSSRAYAIMPNDFERDIYNKMLQERIDVIEHATAGDQPDHLSTPEDGLPSVIITSRRTTPEQEVALTILRIPLQSTSADLVKAPDPSRRPDFSVVPITPRIRLADLQSSQTLEIQIVDAEVAHHVLDYNYRFKWTSEGLLLTVDAPNLWYGPRFLPILLSSRDVAMIDCYLPKPDGKHVADPGSTDSYTIVLKESGKVIASMDNENSTPIAGWLWDVYFDRSEIAEKAHAEAEKLRAFQDTHRP